MIYTPIEPKSVKPIKNKSIKVKPIDCVSVELQSDDAFICVPASDESIELNVKTAKSIKTKNSKKSIKTN